MLDLIIKNGEVIDGSGRERVRADVGIIGDRISAIGNLSEVEANTVIDATSRVVTPGFIDVHTHVDAQVFWDSTLSPSPLHGVTTVVGGNCGFSVAPLSGDPADANYLMRMLSRVEGMPLESLAEGVPWDWITTRDYLERLEGTLSINAGFKVGHSAIRRTVMGEAATVREATSDELAAMCQLLADGLDAGAIGFSSSWSATHNDGDRHMVPSRYATRHELIALCSVLRAYPGTSLEFIPCVGPFDHDVAELMADMAVAAQAPLNWNVLAVTAKNLEDCYEKLAASDVAARRGAIVVGLTAPMSLDFRLSFANGFLLDAIPGWEEAMLLSKEAKLRLLADPIERTKLGALAASQHDMRHFSNWSRMVIYRTVAPKNAGYLGRTIGEIAEANNQSAWDALCDIVIADDLETYFGHPTADEPDANWEARLPIWRDARAVIGASDAGAHLDMFFGADYATRMLHEAVVKRRLLSLEEAIHLLTAVPASLYALRGRGRIAEGAFADIVVFDERSISSNPASLRSDLPAGATRLYADATGIDQVLCNGTEIVRDGCFTDARPGVILRSGQHTG